MSDDRKYKQRGYQESDRPSGPRPDRPSAPKPEREPGAPAGARRISSEGARNPRMMTSRQVARCSRCGTIVDAEIMSRSKCPKCQVDLRSCVQCVNFDPSASLECAERIPARVSPKDVANDCALFSGRTSFERETTAAVSVRRPLQVLRDNPPMGLLSPQDEIVLKQHLSTLSKPVQLVLFTQAFGGSESGQVAKQILDEIAGLNDKITVVEKSFVLDLEDKAKYKVDKAPAIVILSDDVDTRMRMYGAPTGYEFVGLVEAILVAGTGNIDLEPETMAWIQAVTTPTHIQVFSTPT